MSDERPILDLALAPDAETFAAAVRARVADSVTVAHAFLSTVDLGGARTAPDAPLIRAVAPTFPNLRLEAIWWEATALSHYPHTSGVEDNPREWPIGKIIKAAAGVLRIAQSIYDRMDSGRARIRADDLAELLFLGVRFAQEDLIVRGQIDGTWADLDRARTARAARGAYAKKVAAGRIAWHEPAFAKAALILAAQPSISMARLGAMVHDFLERESPVKSPSPEAAVALMRRARRAGRLSRPKARGLG